MTEPSVAQRLADLFRETGSAHHQAFIETDGADPEWPLWYADHTVEKLHELLNAEFTKSELVYLIVMAENERTLRAPGAPWPQYYARFFVDRYNY